MRGTMLEKYWNAAHYFWPFSWILCQCRLSQFLFVSFKYQVLSILVKSLVADLLLQLMVFIARTDLGRAHRFSLCLG